MKNTILTLVLFTALSLPNQIFAFDLPSLPGFGDDPTCEGQDATIFVSTFGDSEIIIGGPDDGEIYAGTLNGTEGNDVIVGTEGNDIINGNGGDDLICGNGGDDTISNTEEDEVLEEENIVNTAPIISIFGDNPWNLTMDDYYSDPGYSAIDYEDGDITSSVVIGGTFDGTGKGGEFIITYDVVDSHGVSAEQKVRNVTVFDDEIGITSGGYVGERPGGEVLGYFVGVGECSPLLDGYLYPNQENDYFEVAKLQSFLQSSGYIVTINGIFDDSTINAVKKIQLKYANEVLQPWVDLGVLDTLTPSGIVGKTTKWKINNLHCSGSESYPIIP